jgi:hypothetical protein
MRSRFEHTPSASGGAVEARLIDWERRLDAVSVAFGAIAEASVCIT